jgi:hypothetical protein
METAYTMLVPLNYVEKRALQLTYVALEALNFINSEFDTNHPILEQEHDKGAFSCVANAFSACLSDIALD